MVEVFRHDIVIVGGGAAGLRAAIEAVEQDPTASVAMVSKVYPMRSHTVSAEGGSAAVAREDDSLEMHGFDTVKGSDFLGDQDVIQYFVEQAPKELVRLEHWGCPWSRNEDGTPATRAFGGMTTKRTWFAADKVGFHMLHALFQTSMQYDRIVRYDERFMTKLLVADGRCQGVVAMDIRTGKMEVFLGRAVILATGGAGKIFPFTTNGGIKTGDGMSAAYRVGVPLKDMEFVQYHPTGLPGTGILITEATRGEGGHVKNKDGERFLVTRDYGVGTKAELGPRDMISRAIVQEIEAGRGFEHRTRQVRGEYRAAHRLADRLGQFLVGPAAFAPVIGFERAAPHQRGRGIDQREQQPGKIVDMDDRARPAGRQRHETELRAAEHLEIVDIVRAIDARRADDGPVEPAGAHPFLGLGLRLAVARKLGLTRGKRRYEDEAFDACILAGAQQVLRAHHIGFVKGIGIGRIGQARNVDHRLRTCDQLCQRGFAVQCALDPCDALALRHVPAGQRAHRLFAAQRLGQHRLPDKAGGPGQRNGHVRTM